MQAEGNLSSACDHTSSPCLSSLDAFLPQLTRKATHTSTRSRIHPFFFICFPLLDCFYTFIICKQMFLYSFLKKFLFDIYGNIVVNFFFSFFIKDLMTHSRIKLSLYIPVSSPAHCPYSFGKMPHINQAGILCSADKQHRHRRICAGKTFHIVCPPHQFKQGQISIICKSEAAKLGILIFPGHLRI